MAFDLFDYQEEAVGKAVDALQEGRTPCIVIPTGGGKTAIMAELARISLEQEVPVIAVAHRLEIVRQMQRSFSMHLGKQPQLITKDLTTPERDVTIAMVQTLIRRKHIIQRMQGRLLLLDECHHALSKSWKKLREDLAPFATAGLTATPVQPSGKGLGHKGGFDELIIGPHPEELMERGFLCGYRLIASDMEVDREGLTVRAGDYVVEELQERVKPLSGSIVRDWLEHNPKRHRTIAVGVSVAHAHDLRQLYRDAGISAETVDGKTSSADRDRIFADFRAGRLEVLVACAVIDEGLDVPEATVLQNTRSTRSIRLWRQLVGRVLRKSPGKEEAIIIDHSGSWRDLPLPHERIDWTLEGKAQSARKWNQQVVRDPLTKKVTILTRVVEVKDQLAQVANFGKTPEERREREVKSLQKTIALIERGVVPATMIRQHMRSHEHFEEPELAAIRRIANLPEAWPNWEGWEEAISMAPRPMP